MKIELIYQLIDKKGISINVLAKSIGMTHTGLTKSLENNTIRVDTLERIAEVLDVSPCYFFLPEGKRQMQEEKLDYFKNEVLKENEVEIMFYSYLEGIICSTPPSVQFIDTLYDSFDKDFEKQFLSKGYYLEDNAPKTFSEVDEATYLLIRLEKDIQKKQDDLNLVINYNIERKRVFVEFVSKVISDNRIDFLLQENIIKKTYLLVIILSVAYDYIGIKPDKELKKYLLKYFSDEEISLSLKLQYHRSDDGNHYFPVISQSNKK